MNIDKFRIWTARSNLVSSSYDSREPPRRDHVIQKAPDTSL
jgi:hypothetical protein